MDRVMFHGKHDIKGYYSAEFFGETFPAIAGVKVKKGIKGYGENGILITFYTLFKPDTGHYCSMLEIQYSRIITFIQCFT